MKEYAITTLGKIRREYKNAEYSGEPCAIPFGFIEKTKAEPPNAQVKMVIDGESITFEVEANTGQWN